MFDIGTAPPSFDRPPASRLSRYAPFLWFVVGTTALVWAALILIDRSNARDPSELRAEIAACPAAAPEIRASAAGRRLAQADDELLARVEVAHAADPSRCGAMLERIRARRRLPPFLTLIAAIQ